MRCTWLAFVMACGAANDAATPATVRSCARATGTTLFQRVEVPHLTDVNANTTGTAFVDLDRDGRLDAVLVREGVHAYLNRGCLDFTPHALDLGGRDTRDANVPTFADFNHDGFLDFYLPASRASDQAAFFLSRGAWDRFVDSAAALGVANPGAYARGSVVAADVDRDGFFELVIGANQIGGSPRLGRPLTRFYVYRKSSDGVYEHGRFVDIGGTDLVSGFGGIDPRRCHPGRELNGMGVELRDLDDDGLLDLVQLAQNDMTSNGTLEGGGGTTDPQDPCANGENPFGIFVWRGVDARQTRFEAVEPGPHTLAQRGQMQYDAALGYYRPLAHAVGHEAMAIADVDNDGDLDVMTTGPTAPTFHVHSDPIMGSLWRNDGRLGFADDTVHAGLASLQWTVGEWERFWGQPITEARTHVSRTKPSCAETHKQPLCGGARMRDLQLYPGMPLFADLDNDGWQDLLVTIRSQNLDERPQNLLYMNRGDGTFELVSTSESGIDQMSLAAQAVDLDGDGLLDLFFMARTSGAHSPRDDVRNKVLLNTGHWRGKDAHANHFVEVRLDGLPAEQLIGAKIFAYDRTGHLLGRRDYFSDIFRGSHDPIVHFGLGAVTEIQLRVVLPEGRERRFANVRIDATSVLDVRK